MLFYTDSLGWGAAPLDTRGFKRKEKMNALPIGKGLLRIIVRSKAKRERLAKISEVRIEGSRVIFPEWLAGNIRRLVEPQAKLKAKKPVQTTLF